MNGNENKILDLIYADVKEIKNKSADTNEKLAVTSTKVEELSRWVGNINKKVERWNDSGCPHGQVLETKINNLDKEVDEAKKECKKTPSKKQSAGAGAATAAIVTAIIQGIMAALGK